ncbi:hypothetical protein QFC22_002508 [Naganishia vaughanmartiniae]|uniref:Uncharacterized protein n=1 Tax=Naganishia vaughanmartiniae TaxID=1424756 RepID=A0ACC2X969_9TREE|nr:hypothetical protein QFC22_002508 [Naganishia vaughanmartiniae]
MLRDVVLQYELKISAYELQIVAEELVPPMLYYTPPVYASCGRGPCLFRRFPQFYPDDFEPEPFSTSVEISVPQHFEFENRQDGVILTRQLRLPDDSGTNWILSFGNQGDAPLCSLLLDITTFGTRLWKAVTLFDLSLGPEHYIVTILLLLGALVCHVFLPTIVQYRQSFRNIIPWLMDAGPRLLSDGAFLFDGFLCGVLDFFLHYSEYYAAFHPRRDGERLARILLQTAFDQSLRGIAFAVPVAKKLSILLFHAIVASLRYAWQLVLHHVLSRVVTSIIAAVWWCLGFTAEVLLTRMPVAHRTITRLYRVYRVGVLLAQYGRETITVIVRIFAIIKELLLACAGHGRSNKQGDQETLPPVPSRSLKRVKRRLQMLADYATTLQAILKEDEEEDQRDLTRRLRLRMIESYCGEPETLLIATSALSFCDVSTLDKIGNTGATKKTAKLDGVGHCLLAISPSVVAWQQSLSACHAVIHQAQPAKQLTSSAARRNAFCPYLKPKRDARMLQSLKRPKIAMIYTATVVVSSHTVVCSSPPPEVIEICDALQVLHLDSYHLSADDKQEVLISENANALAEPSAVQDIDDVSKHGDNKGDERILHAACNPTYMLSLPAVEDVTQTDTVAIRECEVVVLSDAEPSSTIISHNERTESGADNVIALIQMTDLVALTDFEVVDVCDQTMVDELEHQTSTTKFIALSETQIAPSTDDASIADSGSDIIDEVAVSGASPSPSVLECSGDTSDTVCHLTPVESTDCEVAEVEDADLASEFYILAEIQIIASTNDTTIADGCSDMIDQDALSDAAPAPSALGCCEITSPAVCHMPTVEFTNCEVPEMEDADMASKSTIVPETQSTPPTDDDMTLTDCRSDTHCEAATLPAVLVSSSSESIEDTSLTVCDVMEVESADCEVAEMDDAGMASEFNILAQIQISPPTDDTTITECRSDIDCEVATFPAVLASSSPECNEDILVTVCDVMEVESANCENAEGKDEDMISDGVLGIVSAFDDSQFLEQITSFGAELGSNGDFCMQSEYSDQAHANFGSVAASNVDSQPEVFLESEYAWLLAEPLNCQSMLEDFASPPSLHVNNETGLHLDSEMENIPVLLAQHDYSFTVTQPPYEGYSTETLPTSCFDVDLDYGYDTSIDVASPVGYSDPLQTYPVHIGVAVPLMKESGTTYYETENLGTPSISHAIPSSEVGSIQIDDNVTIAQLLGEVPFPASYLESPFSAPSSSLDQANYGLAGSAVDLPADWEQQWIASQNYAVDQLIFGDDDSPSQSTIALPVFQEEERWKQDEIDNAPPPIFAPWEMDRVLANEFVRILREEQVTEVGPRGEKHARPAPFSMEEPVQQQTTNGTNAVIIDPLHARPLPLTTEDPVQQQIPTSTNEVMIDPVLLSAEAILAMNEGMDAGDALQQALAIVSTLFLISEHAPVHDTDNPPHV